MFEPPSELVERNAPEVQRHLEFSAHLGLKLWADQSLEAGQPNERMSVDAAVAQAVALAREGDFTRAPVYTPEGIADFRIESIVGTAAAVLGIAATHSEVSPHESWCRDTVLAAAEIPEPANDVWGPVMTNSILKRAAHGLMALLRAGRGDTAVRLAALRLARHAEHPVSDIVFDGVSAAWDADPLFCRNLVARELALATAPREPVHFGAESAQSAERRALEDNVAHSLSEGRLPTALALQVPNRATDGSDNLFSPQRVWRVLRMVPMQRVIDGTERDWVLALLTSVLVVSIESYVRANIDTNRSASGAGPFGYEWPERLGDALGLLMTDLLTGAESETLVIRPLQAAWPASAELTEGVLLGLTRHGLARGVVPDTALCAWRAFAAWAIPAEPAAAGDRGFISRSVEVTLLLLLHVRNGYATLGRDAAAVPALIAVYARWSEQLAHAAWGFRALLIFLRECGLAIPAPTQLQWLARALDRMPATADRERLWRQQDTGRAAAQLLHGLWTRATDSIRSDAAALSALIAMLDELMRAGVPLAAQLSAQVAAAIAAPERPRT